MNIFDEIRMIWSICGIEFNDNISKLIMFDINKTKQSILNYLNRKNIPEELEYVWLTRAMGATLKTIGAMGMLNSNNFKLEPMVASMTRGDVSMSFKALSREEQINTLISSFETYGEKELNSFRVIKWT